MNALQRPNLTAAQEADLIDDLLRAPALRRHRLPRWMQRGLRRIPGNLIGFHADGATWWLSGEAHDLLDHWGYYVADDGREVFVSEPYDLHADKLEAALAFARQVDADLVVSPVSSHYPGWTVRLEFWPLTPLGVVA